MKNLKTILEVKGRVNPNKDNKTVKTVSISLNDDEINDVLFTLAYVYKNDEQASRYKKAQYQTLYTNIYKDATIHTSDSESHKEISLVQSGKDDIFVRINLDTENGEGYKKGDILSIDMAKEIKNKLV